MNLTDLLSDPVLHLVLHTSAPESRLTRPISWCAPTELLDPSPYLTTNALVLTTGMGLNFHDLRTWDAYVERLAKVPVSGIVLSTGDAHSTVPWGLTEAAGAHEIPVLELMADVPTLLLMRHVESALSTERFRASQRAWELADSCARLAIQGADTAALLDHLEIAASGPVALADPSGTVLFSSRGWEQRPASATTRRRLPLPGELAGQCSLVVPATVGRDVAGPTSAIIAMHVVQALGRTNVPGAAQPFVDALLAGGTTSRTVDETLAAASLHRNQPTLALCLDLAPGSAHSGGRPATDAAWARHFQLWQVRSILEEEGLAVRQAEADGVQVLVVQGDLLGRTADLRPLVERLRALAEEHHLGATMTPVATDPLALQLSLPVALTEPRREGVISQPGEQTLLEMIARSAPIGVRELAADLLRQLKQNDPAGNLVSTMKAVVEAGAQRDRAATSLGIHRNTLSGRLQRIQEITGWDLADGRTLTALAVALRLTER